MKKREKMKPKIVALLTVILIVLLIFSCGKNNNEPDNNENEIILSDITLIMNETNLSEPVIDSTGTTYKYTFTGTPPEINVGNVILGQTDEGYLRKVANVSITGNEITLTTEQACLTNAIQKCSIRDSIQLTIEKENKFNGMYCTYLAKGVSVKKGGINLDNTTLYSGTIGNVTISATIPEGYVSFEPYLNRELEIGLIPPRVEHLLLSAEGILEYDCDLQISTSASIDYGKEILLATFISPPFPIGPVPCFIELSFVAGFETQLDVEGTIKSGFDSEASVEFGAEYYHNYGWNDIWNKSFEFNNHPVEWELTGDVYAKGYITPQLTLKVAGVLGPYMEVEPYLKFYGNVTIPTSWEWYLLGGVDGNLGFEIEILSFSLVDYSTELFNWETVIASDNGVIPNHPPVISSLTADPSSVVVAETSTLTCVASDPDGDNLTYTWDATAGLITGTGASVIWTSPNTEGTYSVSCTVDDGNGGQDIESVNIIVTSDGQWITIFEDGFELYTSGQFPTSNWQPWHNCSSDPTNNIVTTVHTYSGTKSLQVYGSHGGCWSATAVHLISSLPEKLKFEAYFLASGETGTGSCGNTDIELRLDHMTEAATGYNFLGVNFSDDMKVYLIIKGNDNELLQSYILGQWYKVDMEVNTSAKTVTVWIDDTSYGPFFWSTSSLPYPLSEYRAVSISSGDGKGWADEVVIKKWQE